MMTIRRLKALLRSDKGSSTVLIILILLCLTVFSVLSIASSMSDYALASKNASWLKSYYETESKAEHFLGAVNEELSDAKNDASNFDNVPGNSPPTPYDPNAEGHINRAYFLYANRKLSSLMSLPEDRRPSSLELYPSSDFEAPDFLSSEEEPTLYLTANFEGVSRDKKGGETVQNIAVSLEITFEDGNMHILGWREWQPEFDYGGRGMDIWTGE